MKTMTVFAFLMACALAAPVQSAELTRAAAAQLARDPARLAEFVAKLPKVELHRHLEGAIRPETFIAVATKHGITLPAMTVEGLTPLVMMTSNDHTLADFLAKFKVISQIWVSYDVMEEISAQCVRDCHAEGVRAVELRFAPNSMARLKSLDPRKVTEAVIRGVRAGEKETGVVVSLTIVIPRYLPPATGLEIEALTREFVARGAAEFKQVRFGKDAPLAFGQVNGIDLAADEARFPPEPFVPVFQKAEADGIHRTVHAGEALGPESVKVALDGCHAERIGHGVRVMSDVELTARIVKTGVPLEMCPTSNVQTGAVASFAEHPLKKFLDLGGHATLSTDDPGVCGTDMNTECRIAVEKLGCDPLDLENMMLNAADAIFLPPELKGALKSRIKDELAVLNAGLAR